MGKDLNGKELGSGYGQRKDGRYFARIKIEGKSSPIYKYDMDFDSLVTERNKIENNYKYNNLDYTTMTVDEWFEVWMYTYCIHLKDTSISNYIANYKRIKPHIGHYKITAIRNAHIQTAVNRLLEDGYAYGTVVSAKNVVYNLLQKAVFNHYISVNPAGGITIPVRKVKEQVALTNEETEKFFNTISRQRYEPLFRLLYETGVRIGEACALEWTDVDFDAKQIRINKTLNRAKQYNRKGMLIDECRWRVNVTTPKKDASNRTIPMSVECEHALLKWKMVQDKDKMEQGPEWGINNTIIKEHPNLIFTTKKGGIVSPTDAWDYCMQGINRINEAEAIASEIEHREPVFLSVSCHTFRHTFATRCLQAGMNPLAVKEIMGHKTLDMLSHYTHPQQHFINQEFEDHMDLARKTELKQNNKIIRFNAV